MRKAKRGVVARNRKQVGDEEPQDGGDVAKDESIVSARDCGDAKSGYRGRRRRTSRSVEVVVGNDS